MSAYQQRYTPPVRFPVRLSASTTTVLSMFERLMLPNGLIYVDVAVNLTFSAGNQVRAAPPEQTSTLTRATCFGSPPAHGRNRHRAPVLLLPPRSTPCRTTTPGLR